MEKYGYQLPSKHQVVEVQALANQLYLLNINQKVLFINFEFLNNSRYLKVEHQEVKVDSRDELITKIEANSVFLHIPLRSHPKHVDEIITLADYNLNVYRHLLKVEDKLVFVSLTLLFSIESDKLFSEDLLMQSTTFTEYLHKRPSIAIRFPQSIKKIYHLQQKGLLVLEMEDRSLAFLQTASFAHFDFSADGLGEPKTDGMLEDRPYARRWKANCPNNVNILAIFEAYNSVFIRSDSQEIWKLDVDYGQFSYSLTPVPETPGPSRPSRTLGVAETIYQNMDISFREGITQEEFEGLFSDISARDSVLFTQLLSISEDEETTTHQMLVTVEGKLLLIPVFAPLLELTSIVQFALVDTGIANIDRAQLIAERVVFTKDCTLFSWKPSLKEAVQSVQEARKNNVVRAKVKSMVTAPKDPVEEDGQLVFRLNKISPSVLVQTQLNGSVRSIQRIRPLYSQPKAALLKHVILASLHNNTVEILDLDSKLFFLENHPCDACLITALFDDAAGFLWLVYKDCSIEVVRFELESIQCIVAGREAMAGAAFSPNSSLEVQNLIKESVYVSQRVRLGVENQEVFGKLLKAYYHSYFEFDSMRWLGQAEFVRLSRTNLILTYHLRSFFNFLGVTYTDFDKIDQNSEVFIPEFNPVFDDDEFRFIFLGNAARQVPPSSGDRKLRAGTTLDEKTRTGLHSPEVSQYHHFLSNLFRDRFALLRQRLSTLPSHLLIEKSREDLQKILAYRFSLKKSKEDLFRQLFEDFFRDEISQVVTQRVGANRVYYRLNDGRSLRDVFSLPANFESSERGDWNRDFLSLLLAPLLVSPIPKLENIFTFIAKNSVKMPFLKMQVGLQGLGNSLTLFATPLDAPEFTSDLLENNFGLHLSFLTSFANFLVASNGLVSQGVITSIANEFLDRLVLRRKAPLNVFLLVLYFFNDDLQLSAAAQYLLNVFTKNIQTYKSKLQASTLIKEEFKSLYSLQSLGDPAGPALSKIDLTFLMTTFVLLPQSEWMEDEQILRVVFWVLNFVESAH